MLMARSVSLLTFNQLRVLGVILKSNRGLSIISIDLKGGHCNLSFILLVLCESYKETAAKITSTTLCRTSRKKVSCKISFMARELLTNIAPNTLN